jgi:predicted amidohydrolase YtcJ
MRPLPALALVAFAALSGAGATPPAAKADLVLRNGNVHTLDLARPRAQAVAIRGRDIVAVGSNEDVSPRIGSGTRVVDLAGRTVVPGFADSHAHLLGVGYGRLDVDLVGAATFADVVERVARAREGRKPGEWIRGRGWHEGKWTSPPAGAVRGFPTHHALSAVTPENPVVLTRADGHAVLLNAKAMALAGISKQTASPPGGEVIKDAAGNPTGVLVDNAEDLARVPERTVDEDRRALDLAMDECAEKGVTSFTDAGASLETIALYKEYAAQGRLRTRLYVMARGLSTMKALARPQTGLGGGLLTIRAVKLVADGAMGSRGAALLEPYADDPGNTGLVVTPPEEVLEAARYGLAHGFQVATHAIGDRANRFVLDAYAKAFAEAPLVKDPRFRIEHAQILDEKDIPRFGALGVIASMQGIHCSSDRPWAPTRLGMDRVQEGLYVWRKLLTSGARIVNGTDAPVEDLSPIASFYSSVARKDSSGRPPSGFEPDERMTRDEALRSYTSEAAWAAFEGDVRGRVRAGLRADLVVLSEDILTVLEDEIPKTRVLLTVVDGKVRHDKLP